MWSQHQGPCRIGTVKLAAAGGIRPSIVQGGRSIASSKSCQTLPTGSIQDMSSSRQEFRNEEAQENYLGSTLHEMDFAYALIHDCIRQGDHVWLVWAMPGLYKAAMMLLNYGQCCACTADSALVPQGLDTTCCF